MLTSLQFVVNSSNSAKQKHFLSALVSPEAFRQHERLALLQLNQVTYMGTCVESVVIATKDVDEVSEA